MFQSGRPKITQSAELAERQSSPDVVYLLLSLMREMGKRDCFNENHLDLAKKMFTWSAANKKSDQPIWFGIEDKNGQQVIFLKSPGWFKLNFVDAEVE